MQLDLVDAMQTSGAASLQAQLEAFQKSSGADSLAAAFKDAILAGGNATRAAVTSRSSIRRRSACGATPSAMPDRTSDPIWRASRRASRASSCCNRCWSPTPRISPGFGTVSVTLKNGGKVDGTLRQETDSDVVLMAGTPPAERRIAKTEIASRTNPVSAMPPMGALLKPREIRDLVAFLGMLK